MSSPESSPRSELWSPPEPLGNRLTFVGTATTIMRLGGFTEDTHLMGDMRPGVTVPVHYDDYPLFRSPLEDFLAEVRSRGLADGVRTVRRGQTVELTPQSHAAGAPYRRAGEQ